MGGPVLASAVADGDDAAWYLDHQHRILLALLDGTAAGCPHVRGADAIWAFASDHAACCPGCWDAQPPVPLADRMCDMCGTRQAATWMTYTSPGEPVILVAAACDPCEASRVLDLPRPSQRTPVTPGG